MSTATALPALTLAFTLTGSPHEIAGRIAKAGERIILVENDKHSIELRITKLR